MRPQKLLAKQHLETAGKFGVKGLLKGAGKGLLKGGPAGIAALAAQMAGDYFGGQLESTGMEAGDKTKVQQGRALKAGAKALEYAGYGAMAGSFIPVIGNGVGAAAGGVIGGIKGIWDNYFSEDAKKQDQLLKETAEQKAAAEKQEAIKKKQEAINEINKSQTGALAAAAQDTQYWQMALLAQSIEATRLLEAMLFATEDKDEEKEIYLDGKKITRIGYDRSTTMYNAMTKKKT